MERRPVVDCIHCRNKRIKQMMTKPILAFLAGTAALALLMPAQAADNAQEFVNKAAVGGMFEVESSKIAESAAKVPAVKEFAQLMIKDHSAANAKLEGLAGEQKLTLPKALDEKHQASLDELKGTTGAVDQPYVKAQQEAHNEAVALFEGYAQDGDNDALKAFAAETLPTLKMHQEHVEKLASSQSTSASGEPAAPVPGANSFTEAQATERLVEAGYSQVSQLQKDDNGIWRGTAMKGGKSVSVGLDYQGNVVTETK
jgi:putative membrane protein